MKKRKGVYSEEEAIAEVRAVYAELAMRPVERNCVGRTECCQFNITGRVPHLTRGEALVAAGGWRASGRKTLPSAGGVCPMLDLKKGKCLIYQSRPFGCRTHYCRAAGGNLERAEIIDLIHRLETVDARLGGDGSRPLEGAVSTALDKLR